MTFDIFLPLAVLALALLPAWLGTDSRDGRDSQTRADGNRSYGSPHH